MILTVPPTATPPLHLEPETARKLMRWQLLGFGALLLMNNLANAVSINIDYARMAMALDPWKPFVWEFSSGLTNWLLMPLLYLWLQRFPLTRANWWRNLPVHLLATVPFSLAHVGSMVLLRKAVYWLRGETYDFGPWWPSWLYEFNKDFATYWIFLALLVAFHIYALWLDNRNALSDAVAITPPTPADVGAAPLERLVVRKLNREFILKLADVERIDVTGNYVTLYVEGRAYPLRESLVSLEKRLDAKHFARVHRSHIVNINHIREIQPWDHGDYRILMQDGTFVNFSRRYRSQLTHLFN